MKKLFLAVCLFASTAVAFAQKSFEGKIVYEMSFPGMEIPPDQAAMMPKEMVIMIKNKKSRVEMQMGMGMNQITISDGDKKEATMLMDMMGNKMAIKMTEADMKKKSEKEGPEPEVKQTNETKTIAGYSCKKAIITGKGKDGEEYTMPVWYTEELGANPQWNNSQMKGIKGVMLEYEMKQQGMGMKFTAKTVSKESVPDSKFVVPDGYKQMTMEEFQKSMGGMGGGQ